MTEEIADAVPNAELISQCETRYRDVELDHFSWAVNETFAQRYFVCNRYYRKGGPIFFYLGNEADVTLYLNASGLMWESAPSFNALLVFAEHRYYGESKPFSENLTQHMGWLTTEQAMADYAELIWELKDELKDRDAPVIGFGGSYGGMLATWFRQKYPHLLDGAIAGSAPIWTFKGESPAYDSGSFAAVVTRDASEAGGSAPACSGNVRAAWKALFALGESEEGRARAAEALGLCASAASELKSPSDVLNLAYWLSSAWDYLAMGSYPYPSSYMLNGAATLPAFPVRAACEFLKDPELGDVIDPAVTASADVSTDISTDTSASASTDTTTSTSAPASASALRGDPTPLLRALSRAVGVFYNATGGESCFDPGLGQGGSALEESENFWDWQACTEQSMPMTRDGVRDMFWEQDWSFADEQARCESTWGATPRPLWASIEWGGRDLRSASNIVFSNGLLDPWSSGGVLEDLSDTLVSIIIPEGAHHLDLMFSHPLDPPSVTAAREFERAHIETWIAEARASRGSTGVV